MPEVMCRYCTWSERQAGVLAHGGEWAGAGRKGQEVREQMKSRRLKGKESLLSTCCIFPSKTSAGYADIMLGANVSYVNCKQMIMHARQMWELCYSSRKVQSTNKRLERWLSG